MILTVVTLVSEVTVLTLVTEVTVVTKVNKIIVKVPGSLCKVGFIFCPVLTYLGVCHQTPNIVLVR